MMIKLGNRALIIHVVFLFSDVEIEQNKSTIMWPKLLDMSQDECKRLLRRLELEAYAGIISAFRAQGALTEEKKKMLNDLCNMLR